MPDLDGNPASPNPGDNVLGASFLVLGAHAGLSAERILTAGTNISFVDGGPGGTLVINGTGGGASDHGALTGLGDDDHAQYALLAGRGTGQTLIGGTASGNHLSLQSTSHATRGQVRSLDDLYVTRSAAGATVTLLTENTSTSGSSHATIEARVTDASNANPSLLLTVTGVRSYTSRINGTSNVWEFLEDANVRMYAQGQGICIGGQAVSAVSTFSCLYITARAAGGDTEVEIQNASSANKAVLYISQRNATGAITLTAWGTSTSDTIFGDNAANMHALTSGKQFRFGTTAAENLVLGANNLKRVTLFGVDTSGSGVGSLLILNATTNPSSNPSGGGILYADAGAGKWRGSGGTVTTFANAEPHCPVCGRDYMKEFDNREYGYFAFCLPCLADELGVRPWILRGPSRLAA